MTDIYEILLTVNIVALTAVIMHSFITEKKEDTVRIPKVLRKKKKAEKLSDEEKRNAEILDEISKYNGMEVRR